MVTVTVGVLIRLLTPSLGPPSEWPTKRELAQITVPQMVRNLQEDRHCNLNHNRGDPHFCHFRTILTEDSTGF